MDENNRLSETQDREKGPFCRIKQCNVKTISIRKTKRLEQDG